MAVAALKAQDVTPTPEGVEVTPAPVVDQPPVDTSDEGAAAAATLALVLAFVGGLERVTEILKPLITAISDRYELPESTRKSLVVLLSVVLGVGGVLVTNQQLNLLSGLSFVPPLIGTIITGATAGGGAGVVHELFDLVKAWKAVQNVKLLTAYASKPYAIPSEAK